MDAASVSQDQAKPEDQPEPQQPIATPRGGGIWTPLLLALPVLYILSIGPAAKLSEGLDLPQKAPALDNAFGIIYSPIIWCNERFTPLRHITEWYLHLWQVHDV